MNFIKENAQMLQREGELITHQGQAGDGQNEEDVEAYVN